MLFIITVLYLQYRFGKKEKNVRLISLLVACILFLESTAIFTNFGVQNGLD